VGFYIEHANEELSRRARNRAEGFEFRALAEKVARKFDVDARMLSTPTKKRNVSMARAVLCHALVRRHMVSAADVARELNLSPSTVSRAVGRAEKNGWWNRL
jgi:DNA-binding MarR family transcriptional regulator